MDRQLELELTVLERYSCLTAINCLGTTFIAISFSLKAVNISVLTPTARWLSMLLLAGQSFTVIFTAFAVLQTVTIELLTV